MKCSLVQWAADLLSNFFHRKKFFPRLTFCQIAWIAIYVITTTTTTTTSTQLDYFQHQKNT